MISISSPLAKTATITEHAAARIDPQVVARSAEMTAG